jgi:hypothetical protein
MRKGPTYIGATMGSLAGSFVPALWGAGQLSLSSVLFFVIGGLAGIWLAYRLFV